MREQVLHCASEVPRLPSDRLDPRNEDRFQGIRSSALDVPHVRANAVAIPLISSLFKKEAGNPRFLSGAVDIVFHSSRKIDIAPRGPDWGSPQVIENSDIKARHGVKPLELVSRFGTRVRLSDECNRAAVPSIAQTGRLILH